MPTVLLTRPRASSERLAVTLQQRGYATVIEPLLSILPTHVPIPDISGVKAVMITSGNALTVLEKSESALSALTSLPCFCVGTSTASQARAFGFRNVYDADGDGAALAQLIQAEAGDAKTVLHIAGRDIASLAHDTLQHAGFSIIDWPVYAAEPVAMLSDHAVSLLKDGRLDAVLLFSARTAETLKTLLARHGLEACCAGLLALGMSDAVMACLKPLPWKHLETAPQPTEGAMIGCLQTLLPVS